MKRKKGYIAANMVRDLGTCLKVSVAILVALIAHHTPNLASNGTVCNKVGFSTGLYLCLESCIRKHFIALSAFRRPPEQKDTFALSG